MAGGYAADLGGNAPSLSTALRHWGLVRANLHAVMSTYSYALFDTAIGRCGIGWSDHGIACVQLPEATVRDTKKRICDRLTDTQQVAPPANIQATIEGIAALLQGKQPNLKHAKLDMADIAPFHRRVYEVTRRIAPGATVTYGDIAHRLGAPGAARAVGQALGRNPFAIIVPCHRVLAANGKLRGFSAHGGVSTKRRLLMIEGAVDRDPPIERMRTSSAIPLK